MLRKRGKKCVYTLPRLNPRAATLNSTKDAHKLGKDIEGDVVEILNYALKPIQEGEEDRVRTCYDGSDIPDDNTKRPPNVMSKTNQNSTSSNVTTRTNTGRAQDRAQHTVNFKNREQHRTITLEDIQQWLTQMVQKGKSANTENIRHVRPHF